jgi:hypothetical protein
MFSLTGPFVLVLVIAVILVIFVVGIFLYLASRLRARRTQLLNELSSKPELIQDRAFNRLAMARREAEVVARTGAEVGRARELIAQSQSAFDLHQYPRAYELAQSAHENLVNARSRPLTSAAPVTDPHPVAPPLRPAPTDPVVRGNGTAAGAAAPLAKNRAESHFQLGMLESDLTAARSRGAGNGKTQEAEALFTQSQAAFDRAEYSESFRLALRGRRALGSVETLAPTPGAARAPSASADAPDPVEGAERLAGSERCPSCGYPMVAEDAYCRGCGVPRANPTCPSCGARRTPADTFCGKCGARFSA